jgi:ABC-2 type transport system permease protein
MRSIAEERQTGTEVLIDSSPLSVGQFVGGKYLAAFGVMALLVILTLYMPALVFVNGRVSYGQIFAGYLGLLLVASATTSIGVFTSAISRSQLVAVILAAVTIGFFVLAWLLAKVVDPPLKDIISYFGFYDRHFRNFGRGQVHTESVIYFVSLTFMFLTMATRFLAVRRWR